MPKTEKIASSKKADLLARGLKLVGLEICDHQLRAVDRPLDLVEVSRDGFLRTVYGLNEIFEWTLGEHAASSFLVGGDLRIQNPFHECSCLEEVELKIVLFSHRRDERER